MNRYAPFALLAVLIAYGSLYPFQYVAPPSFASAFSTFIHEHRLWTSLGDEVGNFALFVPLGAAAVISLPAGRSTLIRIITLFVGCIALSFITQVAQIYFPPRDAQLADVLSNAVGTFAGMLGGLLIRYALSVRVPILQRQAWLALLILTTWMMGDLWPLVPSIDWSAWKESVKPLLFARRIVWGSVLFHLAAVLLVAELIGALARRSAVRLLVALSVLVMFVGKVLVVGQHLELSFALGSTLGLLALGLFQRLGQARLIWLLTLLCVTFTIRSLQPLELRNAPAAISWIPFASFLNGNMDTNALSLANSAYFFVGMLWLAARIGGKVWPVTVLLTLWVAAIEFAQRWLVGHSSDITQPLLVIGAGYLVSSQNPAVRAGHPIGVIPSAHKP